MRIDILTVFPEMVSSALSHSIVKRAQDAGLVDIRVVNIRDYTTDRHKTTDDTPYGGGGGMIMKIEPIARALLDVIFETGFVLEPSLVQMETLFRNRKLCQPRIAITDPRGQKFTQNVAQQWAKESRLVLLCGHYEGVDERVRRFLVTDEVSIGDFILTGGELPALAITDALTRLQAGVLGDADAPDKDTFSDSLLEYPHYTRPREFYGLGVPEMLMCGHHAEIERWRRWQQLQETKQRRPDLFELAALSPADRRLLNEPEPVPPTDKRAERNSPQVRADESDISPYEENDGTHETSHT